MKLTALPLPTALLALAALSLAPRASQAAPPPPPEPELDAEADEAPPADEIDDGLGSPSDSDALGDETFDEQPEPEPEPEPAAEAEAGVSVDLDAERAEKPDEELVARHRVTYLNLMAARYNPLGLEERLWMGYQRRLYDKPDALWAQSNVAVFGNLLLSPAIARIGATLQYQPLTILRFRATYGFQGWFGTFQYMRSYDSPHADHAESTLKEDADEQRNYATIGHQLELGMLFQIKAGPVALRSNTNVYYNQYRLQGKNDVFYDVRIDALVPNNGWALMNDTDLLYISDFGLLAGARATTTKAFFGDTYEPGDTRSDPNGPQFRVGPAIGYEFFNRPGAKFNKPLILLLAQWHVKHRYRTGLDVNQGIPTLALAFKFEGDLWKKNDK